MFDQARMHFYLDIIDVTLSSSKGTTGGQSLMLAIEYGDSVWQFESLTQAYRPFSPSWNIWITDNMHNVVRDTPPWADDMGNARWLELLDFFPAVESLYLSEELALCIAPALQELANGEGVVSEVLPVLQNIFIERFHWLPSESGIGEFVTARELSGHPVAVHHWEKK